MDSASIKKNLNFPSINEIIKNITVIDIQLLILFATTIFMIYLTISNPFKIDSPHDLKFHCLVGGLISITLQFILSFFIVLRKRRSNHGFINRNSFFLNQKAMVGIVALILCVTFISIVTSKYTQFEHIFIMFYSILSLYLLYFYISRLESPKGYQIFLPFLSILFMTIFVLVKAITYVSLIDLIWDSINHSNKEFSESLELSKNVLTQIEKFVGKTDDKYIKDQNNLIQTGLKDLEYYRDMTLKSNCEFQYSFLFSLFSKKYEIPDYISSRFSKYEISFIKYVDESGFAIANFRNDFYSKLYDLLVDDLMFKLQTYDQKYEILLKSGISQEKMNLHFKFGNQLVGKFENLKMFLLRRYHNHDPRLDTINKVSTSLRSSLEALNSNFYRFEQFSKILDSMITQMEHLEKNPDFDINSLKIKYENEPEILNQLKIYLDVDLWELNYILPANFRKYV